MNEWGFFKFKFIICIIGILLGITVSIIHPPLWYEIIIGIGCMISYTVLVFKGED